MLKILVFGLGKGYSRLKNVLDYERVEIAACIDNDSRKWGSLVDGSPVIAPDDINQFDYDYIVLTSQFYSEIEVQLAGLGIAPDKILNFFSNNIKSFLGHQDACIFDMEKLSGHHLIISRMEQLKRERRMDLSDGDYMRYSSMELMAEEIYSRNIRGNTAELGVFRGAFSRKINELFPDRKLYLFDTFEGFVEKDMQLEKNKNYSAPKRSVFADTSAEAVLQKMKHPENCIVRQGYFPQTAEGLEDEFVFVSIDADLYNPIYAGLQYFYPRLVSGGSIMVHDYNNVDYVGAKQAVRQFCAENGIGFTPLSDLCGSAVIAK